MTVVSDSRLVLTALIVLLDTGAGCSKPSANGLLCSAQMTCPAGFRCYTTTTGPRCYDYDPRPDAGDIDALTITTADSGSTTCSHLLCEDFEDPAPLQRWGVTNFYSTIEVDGTRFHRGARSLHVRLTDPQNDPSYDPAHLVPTQGEISRELGPLSDYFMRFYVYAPPLPGEQIRIAAIQENHPEDYPDVSLWLNEGHLDVTFPDFSSRESSDSVASNDWACVEWQVTIGNPGAVRAWIWGAPAEALAPVTSDTSKVGAAADQLAVVGAAIFAEHPVFSSHDLWFDDVVVDARRIGCGD